MTYGRYTYTYCRYNVDHKCTDKRHRQECIEAKNSEYVDMEYKRYVADCVKENEE
jgi:hypothetical protein